MSENTSKRVGFRVLITGFGPFNEFKVNPSWLAVKPLRDTTLSLPDSARSDDPDPDPANAIYISAFQIPAMYEKLYEAIPKIHRERSYEDYGSRSNSLSKDKGRLGGRIGVQVPGGGNKNFVAQIDTDPDFIIPETPEGGYDFILHVGTGNTGPLELESCAHKVGYNKFADIASKIPDLVGYRDTKVPDGKKTKVVKMPIHGYGAEYEEFPETIDVTVDVQKMVTDLRRGGVSIRTSNDAGHYVCDYLSYGSLVEAQRVANEKSAGGSTHLPIPVLFLHCPPVNQPLSTDQVTDGIRKVVFWICQGLKKGDCILSLEQPRR